MRREFTRATRAAAFLRAEGNCEHVDSDGCRCNIKLRPGNTHFDHIVADSIGGEPTLDNCQVLCRVHHDIKTRTLDTPRAAKVKRIRDKHFGIVKPKRPWPKRPMSNQWRNA